MLKEASCPSRRAFLKSAAVAAAGYTILGTEYAQTQSSATVTLFDGKTLNGWIQIENSATSFSRSDITDFVALARQITGRTSAVASFVKDQLDMPVRDDVDSYTPVDGDTDAVSAELVKNLNTIIASGPIYDKARFKKVKLRPATEELLRQSPHGTDLVRLNRMLLEDAFPEALAKSASPGWIVKDGAMASTGAGRGVIYTAKDYSHYRLMFTMRHVSGKPDHQACVLIFCTRPAPAELALDALGGIQFQVPNGGHWDYRPGKNIAGGPEFTKVTEVKYDPHEWSRVEILADASKGTARMAVAQPVGGKAVEVLDFTDPTAGKPGPIAWQMHNAGLFDEYKDVVLEENPANNDLITVK
jgi:hypothetical protein